MCAAFTPGILLSRSGRELPGESKVMARRGCLFWLHTVTFTTQVGGADGHGRPVSSVGVFPPLPFAAEEMLDKA